MLYLLSPRLPEAEASLPEALVIRSVRLPRLFAAVGTGGLLSVSGALLQGILANPLAEPYTLGIAAGAAFGGALGLLLGTAAVIPAAFVGAVGALCLVGLIVYCPSSPISIHDTLPPNCRSRSRDEPHGSTISRAHYEALPPTAGR